MFEAGIFSRTVNILGDRQTLTPNLVDLRAFHNVTRISIHDITDPAGLAWDDFAFDIGTDPDIVATGLDYVQRGVTFSYDVVVSDIPSNLSPKINLYWADGAGNPLGGPIASQDMQHAQGSYVNNFAAVDFTTAPAGANELLVRVDANNVVTELLENNNNSVLPLRPDIVANGLNYAPGGVTFSYTVAAADIPGNLSPTINLYWATADGTPLGNPIASQVMQHARGSYPNNFVNLVGIVPPESAAGLVVRADANDVVTEINENNNSSGLALSLDLAASDLNYADGPGSRNNTAIFSYTVTGADIPSSLSPTINLYWSDASGTPLGDPIAVRDMQRAQGSYTESYTGTIPIIRQRAGCWCGPMRITSSQSLMRSITPSFFLRAGFRPINNDRHDAHSRTLEPEPQPVIPTITGTAGDDVFEFNAADSTLTVNGVSRTLTGEHMIDGLGGSDTIWFYNSINPELNYSSGTIGTIAYANMETVAVCGTGTATFHDSTGDDNFQASWGLAQQAANGLQLVAYGFQHTVAHSTQGDDVARLYTRGDATLTMNTAAATARCSGAGFDNQATGFRNVEAYALSSGNSSASITGTTGDDVFIATSIGAQFLSGGHDYSAWGFRHTRADGQGGNDIARFYGSVGGDESFIDAPSMRRTRASILTGKHGLHDVEAYVDPTGDNTATLNGTSGRDRAVTSPIGAQLFGDDYTMSAWSFRTLPLRQWRKRYGGQVRDLEQRNQSDAERFRDYQASRINDLYVRRGPRLYSPAFIAPGGCPRPWRRTPRDRP